jgi:hypothetical protein
MRRLASERGKQVANRRGGGGKCVENRKKILNGGNEPKNLLKAKELALSGAQNELVFERKKGQSKRKMGPKIWKMDTRNSKIETRKSPAGAHLACLEVCGSPRPDFSLSRGERVTRVRRFHQPARVG